jgi:hypothetical protein
MPSVGLVKFGATMEVGSEVIGPPCTLNEVRTLDANSRNCVAMYSYGSLNTEMNGRMIPLGIIHAPLQFRFDHIKSVATQFY